MYYTSINDNEAKIFHKQVKCNFKMNIINFPQKLFKEEGFGSPSRILPYTIVKYYTLFYTDEIKSDGEKDKILGNKCAIVLIENEVYSTLEFINHDAPAPNKMYLTRNKENIFVYDEHLKGIEGVSLKNTDPTITCPEIVTDKFGFALGGETTEYHKVTYNSVEYDYDDVYEWGVTL